MTTTDVLIIGAGPTGGILALELATRNIPFRLIDSSPIRSEKSRAPAVQSRSLELLHHHEIAERLVERGYLNPGVRTFCKKFSFEVDLKDMDMKDTKFPTPLMVSQATMEGLLDEILMEKFGRSVERSVCCEKLNQGGVTAWLRKEDGTEEKLTCKYAVGCDGAHSMVRKAAGLDFQGAAYPQDFILADVRMKWEQKSCLNLFLGNGTMVVIPMKDGIFRLICSRPEHLNKDDEPTLKDFREITKMLAPGATEILEALWLSRFRLHHRIVDNYRAGRLFLAGDAAHIHSPAGGQGMNTGMQDAANLGWKLARVIRGESEDSFLDTYNTERRKIGTNLLKGTDRMFEFATSSNRIYIFLRNILVPYILPWVMRDRVTRGNRFRFVSQLEIRYRHSPIVGQASGWKGMIRGGDRVLDGKLLDVHGETSLHELFRGRSHHLLIFSGLGNLAVDAEVLQQTGTEVVGIEKSIMIVHTIVFIEPAVKSVRDDVYMDTGGVVHGLYGFSGAGYVLVRPDGYISFIGPLSSIDELKSWLK